MNKIESGRAHATGPASATRSDVQARNLGGLGGPSNARPGGGAESGFPRRIAPGCRTATQDACAITVPQAEQCPLAQQPRSHATSVRTSSRPGICARSSGGAAGIIPDPESSLTCCAACTCGTPPWAAAPDGASATSRKAASTRPTAAMVVLTSIMRLTPGPGLEGRFFVAKPDCTPGSTIPRLVR